MAMVGRVEEARQHRERRIVLPDHAEVAGGIIKNAAVNMFRSIGALNPRGVRCLVILGAAFFNFSGTMKLCGVEQAGDAVFRVDVNGLAGMKSGVFEFSLMTVEMSQRAVCIGERKSIETLFEPDNGRVVVVFGQFDRAQTAQCECGGIGICFPELIAFLNALAAAISSWT